MCLAVADTTSMSVLLVAVVGFILLILFIVFVMAVAFLKVRRPNVYPPPVGMSKVITGLPHGPNMYDYTTLPPMTQIYPQNESWSNSC